MYVLDNNVSIVNESYSNVITNLKIFYGMTEFFNVSFIITFT